MLGRIVRAGVGTLTSLVVGATLGAVYAGLVGVVHLGAYGRWDRVPAFAAGWVLVGAVLGLLGRMAWVLSGEAASGTSDEEESDGMNTCPGSRTGICPLGSDRGGILCVIEHTPGSGYFAPISSACPRPVMSGITLARIPKTPPLLLRVHRRRPNR